ncbi:hypothetical protein MHK_006389, partial [Candidatus Magnetomorum sp. HK-1]
NHFGHNIGAMLVIALFLGRSFYAKRADLNYMESILAKMPDRDL